MKADMTKERLEITQELTAERDRGFNLGETVKLLKQQAELYQVTSTLVYNGLNRFF